MLKTKTISITKDKPKSESIRPKLTRWKGVMMVRKHSFLATVAEILEYSKELDLVRVGIIGDQSSGKSSLSLSIAHCLHKLSKIPFAVRVFDKESLLDFQNTLKSLQPTNHILIFDDVSFLGASASKKQLDVIKQAVTTIRHLEGGKDVKIIIVMNYHYTLGLDKYLRMSDFRYFTTIGSSEKENMEKIAGTKYIPLVETFQRLRRHGLVKKEFRVALGKGEVLSYRWRNPFIPVLFWNNSTLRLVVTPLREWIDPICSICAEAAGTIQGSEISIPTFCGKMEKSFGPQNFKAAVKLLLYVEGKTVWGNKVVQALRAIDKARKQKLVSLEEVATHYGYQITKTKLKKNIDEALVT